MDDTAPKEITTPSKSQRLFQLLRDARLELKQTGVKGLFRRYGWKLVAGVFTYYLVRDVTLYILIPWLVAKHLLAV